RLYTRVLQAHREGAFPVILGGDHSLAAGSVAATSAFAAEHGERIGLIWVDAHGDMNTPATTTTGNVHGMPLAALLGPEPAELAKVGGAHPKVHPDNTVLIGVRSLDEAEKGRVRDSHVHLITMKEIDRHGRPRLPRGAHAHGDAGRLGTPARARPRRGQPNPRRPEPDGHARRRTDLVSPRAPDYLKPLRATADQGQPYRCGLPNRSRL